MPTTPTESYVYQRPHDDPHAVQAYADKCAFYSGDRIFIQPVGIHTSANGHYTYEMAHLPSAQPLQEQTETDNA